MLRLGPLDSGRVYITWSDSTQIRWGYRVDYTLVSITSINATSYVQRPGLSVQFCDLWRAIQKRRKQLDADAKARQAGAVVKVD